MDESSNETNGNALEVDGKLMDCHVATEKMLADTPKRTQEGTQARPQSFNRVGVDFADAIAVIVARPLVNAMRHRRTRTLNGVVTVVLVGVDMRAFTREAFDVRPQRDGLGVLDHPQTHLPALPPNRAQDGRTVI